MAQQETNIFEFWADPEPAKDPWAIPAEGLTVIYKNQAPIYRWPDKNPFKAPVSKPPETTPTSS